MSSSANGPVGLGGWLVLPIAGMFLSMGRIAYAVLTMHLPLVLNGTLTELSNPEHPAYHPLWVPLFCIEVIANLSVIAVTIVVLVLIFTRSRHAPGLAIFRCAFGPAVLIGDWLIWRLVPAVAEQPVEPRFMYGLAGSITAMLIWIPYFMRSKRVRNTFVVDWPRLPGSGKTNAVPPPLPATGELQ